MSIIELKDVHYTYDKGTDSEIEAIRGVSLSINEGEFVAFVGHNGSGKSTMAKLLNALVEPTSGEVIVNGLNTNNSKNYFDIRKTVGVVFQNPDNQMVATIIEDDVAFGPENLGLPSDEIRNRVDFALKSVGMYDYREKTAHRLSGGQKQRVAIAGVLAIKPKVMILDESTAMLDPEGRSEVMKVITHLNREEGMTVIMITHFMEEASVADRIVVFSDGKVIMDGGKEILLREEELKAVHLSVPFATRIANSLRKNGVKIDGTVTTVEELVNKLCR